MKSLSVFLLALLVFATSVNPAEAARGRRRARRHANPAPQVTATDDSTHDQSILAPAGKPAHPALLEDAKAIEAPTDEL